MAGEKDIELIMGLSKEDPQTKITFTKQAMAEYPQHLKNLDVQFLMSGDPQGKTKLDLLSNFRSELNFWCRDNCKGVYKIEELFEPQGMRVYFVEFDDAVAFERDHNTVVPPPMPSV